MLSLALETVDLRVDGHVAWLTLNRPAALNAWTEELGRDMIAALDHIAADNDVRAVVLSGAGRAFSSGADVKAGFDTADGGAGDADDSRGRHVLSMLREVYNPLLMRVRSMPKPVIAAVNGGAAGIGCSLALVADLIVAAESAYFLLAFANIGLALDGGLSASLIARIGLARAMEMALLAERIPAARALEWGLINAVVPDGELTRAADELATRLAAGPTGAYAVIKRTLGDAAIANFAESLDREAVLQQGRAASPDLVEGLSAFVEKRRPNFPGS